VGVGVESCCQDVHSKLQVPPSNHALLVCFCAHDWIATPKCLCVCCSRCVLLQDGAGSSEDRTTSAPAAPASSAAGAAAPAAAAAAAAAVAADLAADGHNSEDVQPEEGAEVGDGLLSPPRGASPVRRTSPRLQAREEQQQEQLGEQQPFSFSAAAAAATATADGRSPADAAAVGAGGTAIEARQSARQQQRRQRRQEQQEQEQLQQQGTNPEAADPAAAAAASQAFADALSLAQELIGDGLPADGAYEKLTELYDVSCLLGSEHAVGGKQRAPSGVCSQSPPLYCSRVCSGNSASAHTR
jgi:hypothetical protein